MSKKTKISVRTNFEEEGPQFFKVIMAFRRSAELKM